MQKTLITILLAILLPCTAMAAKQTINSGEQMGTARSKINTNFTELYDGKADKTAAVRYWSDWPESSPGNVLAIGTIVAYNGTLYKTTQQFTKTAGATPDGFTAYFSEITGNGTGVVYQADCSGISTGLCVDSDDGKLYYHNGTSVVEVASGGSYTLPTASADTLGGVKIGSRLTITNGLLSADVQSIGSASSLTDQYIDWSASSGGASIANKPTLGTAAALNVGTSANNIPQLGSGGLLPDSTIPGTTFTASNLGWINQEALETFLGWSFTGGLAHATSDGNYYASRNGAWTSLYHVYQPYDANLPPWPSAVSATEVGYLDGVTSGIQAQINALSAGSGGTTTVVTSDPYSDVACTGAKYNSTNDRFFPCLGGYHIGYVGLTDFSNPQLVTRTLTVNSPNNGTITCSDSDLSAPINCGTGGAVCSATAADGASITGITATADSGYALSAWSGDLSGSTNPTTLTMSANRSIGATFSSSSVSVTDNFNRSNGGLGSNWTALTGTLGATTLAVASNAVVSGAWATYASSIYTGSSFSNDQYAEIKIGTEVDATGPMVRMSSAGTGYAFQAGSLTSGYIVKCASGTCNGLGSSITLTSISGTTIRLEVEGTTLSLYRNGTLVDTRTDSDYSSGSPGITTHRSTTESAIDDFAAGDL